jgi:hypothetical protein
VISVGLQLRSSIYQVMGSHDGVACQGCHHLTHYLNLICCSWNSQYDCDIGECSYETDDNGMRRIVAYSGLLSHAMYPTPSPLHVYMKVLWGAQGCVVCCRGAEEEE